MYPINRCFYWDANFEMWRENQARSADGNISTIKLNIEKYDDSKRY